MYFCTSCYFLNEVEYIYERRTILWMKRNVFMNFVLFFAWNNVFVNSHYLYEAECVYELRVFFAWHDVFFNFVLFFVRSRMYLWTSYFFFVCETQLIFELCHSLYESECIYELRIILCMKQCVFELLIIICLIQNVFFNCVIFCMKQNVFMSFVFFLHLTDIISPYSIDSSLSWSSVYFLRRHLHF